MKTYVYKLKDENGKILYGFMEADDKIDLKKRLRQSSYFFVSAQPFLREKIFKIKGNLEMLLMFTRRLTSLIESGIPILTAMNILWRQTEDRTIQLVVSHIRQNLEQGQKISEALEDFPNIFPKIYIAMIAVAEKAGGLVAVLRRLTEYLTYQKEMMTRIKKATLYPIIVTIFAFLVVMFMFMFVVPTFSKALFTLKVELPWLTQVIINFSMFIRSWYFWGGVLFLGVLGYFIYRYLRKNPKFSYYIDSYKLKIPVVGYIIHSIALSRFMHSLSVLLGAGLPIVDSFQVSQTTTGNRKIVSGIKDAQKKIEQGGSLYDSFKGIHTFPVMLVEMIGVGEASGNIVKIMTNMAKHFDDEVEYNQNKLFTYMEPALIICVGGIIIVTLLAIYLPIFSVWQGLMK